MINCLPNDPKRYDNYSYARQCPVCVKMYTPELVFTDKVKALDYINRIDTRKVQEIFPDATSTQREQLITGICSNKCWNERNWTLTR